MLGVVIKEHECSFSQLTGGTKTVLLKNFILLSFQMLSATATKILTTSKPTTSELNNQTVNVFGSADHENFPLHILSLNL